MNETADALAGCVYNSFSSRSDDVHHGRETHVHDVLRVTLNVMIMVKEGEEERLEVDIT